MRSHTNEMLSKGADFGLGRFPPERLTRSAPDTAHPGVVKTRPNMLGHTPRTAGTSRLTSQLSSSDAPARLPWCGEPSWVAA